MAFSPLDVQSCSSPRAWIRFVFNLIFASVRLCRGWCCWTLKHYDILILTILLVDQASVALVYFLIASVYLLLSLLLYLFVSKHKFYVHFATTQRQSIGKTEMPYKANIKEVAFKVWIPALTVLIVYLVTLGNQCSASKDLVIL